MEEEKKKEIDDVINQNSTLRNIKKNVDTLTVEKDTLLEKIKEMELSINELKRDSLSETELSQCIERYAQTFYTKIQKETDPIIAKGMNIAESNKNDISKINGNINETKKKSEEISLSINNLLKILPETERKYGEIEALYKKEQEISAGKDNRIKELNKALEIERGRSSQLDKSLSEKDTELTKLKEQEESVVKERDDLEKSLLETRNNLEKAEKDYSSLKTEKENLVQELNDIRSRYENLNIDDNLILAYNEYCSLSAKTKDNLNSIFQQRTFLGFISCGLRFSNVTALWEFAKRNAFNSIFDDLTILNHIFCILIEVYNAGFNEKQYEVITPSVGTKFDSSTSSERTMKPNGIVQEIFLAGYRSIKEGNLHKAVVGV